MMKLYEYDPAISECIDLETGEILDVEKLNALQLEKAEKIDNVIKFIKSEQANVDAINNEIKALQAKKKIRENSVKNMRSYLQEHLNGEKFKSALFTVNYRVVQNVDINEDELPKKYWVVTKAPDKMLIKNQFKVGKKVKGCKIVESVSMVIK